MRFWTNIAAVAILTAAVTPTFAEEAPSFALAPGGQLTPNLQLAPNEQLAQMPPPVMMSPAMSWAGCYVGLNGGGMWGGSTFTWSNVAVPPFIAGAATVFPANANSTLSGGGGLGGAQAGCNFAATPNLVVGFEGDFDGTSLSGNRAAAAPGTLGVIPTSYRESFSQNWLSTARGRVGYATGSWLFYGTAGLAVANANFFDQVCGPTGGPFTTCNTKSTGSTRIGWTAGGGLEWMFNPSWSVKLEYLYAQVGNTASQSTTRTFPGAVLVPGSTITHDHSLDDNIVRVGFNYHFAPPPPPPAPMAMPAPPPAAPTVFIVFFDWDKDTITREGMQIVQQAADAWKSGAPVQIQVTGYTDRSGSVGYNQRLSERRANNVAKAMAALGVPPAEMVVSGKGENDNRVPTANGVREPQNRRVEIIKS